MRHAALASTAGSRPSLWHFGSGCAGGQSPCQRGNVHLLGCGRGTGWPGQGITTVPLTGGTHHGELARPGSFAGPVVSSPPSRSGRQSQICTARNSSTTWLDVDNVGLCCLESSTDSPAAGDPTQPDDRVPRRYAKAARSVTDPKHGGI
jgi:hypothetical protein